MHYETSTEKTHCPSCGEQIELVLDNSEPEQTYIEDCQVCCRPIVVSVSVTSSGFVELSVRGENDA